jgi:GntR family transcriptional regulator/MocR family aminotransferase
MKSGTNSGGELLLTLDRRAPSPLRAQLEDGLRDAVRSGRLPPHSRLPASRALAGDLGVSRRLVVDAYAQLLAEGYLSARGGAGTYVAGAAGAAAEPEPEPEPVQLTFDFFPGHPDLSLFPRRRWLRALRETLREMPDRSLGYPDPRGALALRRSLAEHLRRVRGVVADPESILICAGAAQAFALLAQTLGGRGRMAVEDPGLPVHRTILAENGAELVAVEVDELGLRVEELGPLQEQGGAIAAVLVTPAHQSPTGVALAPERRARLLAWAAEAGGYVIEDDYDAEFRYDRAPLGALQGLVPERVIYTGTVSKTLAPALRVGWLVLPPALTEEITRRKLLADHGSATIEQLALARVLDSGAYDSHLRAARRRYRARRDALVQALARHLPAARVEGVAAGLHAIARLPQPVPGLEVMRAAATRSVGVYPVGYGYLDVRPLDDRFVLGYANLAEPAIDEGIRRFAEALEEVARGPAPANSGGAIAR